MSRCCRFLFAISLISLMAGVCYAKGVLTYNPNGGISIKDKVEKPFLNTITEFGKDKILVLEQITDDDLQTLAAIKAQVKWLRITDSAGLKALDNIAALTDIERLELDALPHLEDLSALSSLKNLTYLYIKEVNVRDISFVKDLPNIETLIFVQQPKEPLDISPLEGKTTLQTLRFGGAKIGDLSPISNLTRLNDLSLAGTQVTDLKAIGDLVLLERLDLTGVKATKLKPIESLTKLKWLKISGTRFHDYQVLVNCINLQTLMAGMSRLNRLDFVEAMPNLKVLKLFKNPIYNLEPLAKAKNLEILEIRHMSANLKPLSSLLLLKELSLEKARVSNPEAIAKLPSLEVLDLRGVINYRDLSLLQGLPKLKTLYVRRGEYPAHQTSLFRGQVVFQ